MTSAYPSDDQAQHVVPSQAQHREAVPAAAGPAPVRVFLLGGPAGLPRELREYPHPVDDRKIKVRFRGGYEHFERDDETVAEEPRFFRWTMRTRIAE